MQIRACTRAFLVLPLLAGLGCGASSNPGASARESDEDLAGTIAALTSVTRLDVFPSSLAVAAGWDQTSTSITLTADAPTGGALTVVVAAGGGLRASCTGQEGPYLEECTIPSTVWEFAPLAQTYRATHEVWFARVASTTTDQSSWQASVESSTSPTMRRLVTLTTSDDPPVQGTLPAAFAGYVTLAEPVATDNPSDGYTPLQVPVDAWVTADEITLFDRSRTLSATGELTLDRRAVLRQVSWDAQTSTTALQGDTVVIRSTFEPIAANAQQAAGKFTFTLPLGKPPQNSLDSVTTELQWAFLLDRVGALPGTACPCAATSHCVASVNRCAAGPATVFEELRCSADWASCSYVTPTSTWQLPPNYVPAILASFGKPVSRMKSTLLESWLVDERKVRDNTGNPYRTGGEAYTGAAEYICSDFETGTPRTFVDSFLAFAGDRACATSAPERYAPIFTHRDREGVTDTPHMLRECVAELGQPVPRPALPYDDIHPAQTVDWYRNFVDDGDCVTPARFLPLLDVTFRQPGEYQGDGLPAGAEASGNLFGHLVGRWLQVHAFVATQGREEILLNQRLDDLGPTDPYASGQLTPPPSMPALLDLVRNGWSVLRDQRYLHRLGMISAAELREPDARQLARPASYWPMDAASIDAQTHVLDDVSGARHAAVQGSFAAASGGGITLAADTLIALPAGDELAPGNIGTISLWVRPDAIVNAPGSGGGATKLKKATILAFESSEPDHPLTALLGIETATGGVRFTWRAPGTTALSKTQVWPTGGYYHIVVGGPGPHQLHVNSGPADALEDAPATVDARHGRWLINPIVDNRRLAGAVAELAFWRRPITWAQIEQLDAAGRGTRGATAYVPTPPEDSDKEHGVPVAVSILEGLSTYLQLVAEYHDDLRSAASVSCMDPGSSSVQLAAVRQREVMATALVLDRAAEQMWTRASRLECEGTADCGTGATCSAAHVCVRADGVPLVRDDLPWAERWYAARREYASRRAETLAAFNRLSRCDDLHELPPKYVPIVFPDGTQPNERFFASSRHFVNTWAMPALGDARALQGLARTAWLQLLHQHVQQKLEIDDIRDRMLELKRGFGREIVSACGMEDTLDEDALTVVGPGGEVSVDSCFVESNPTCRVAAADLLSAVTDGQARYALCTWNAARNHLGLEPDYDAAAVGWQNAHVSGAYVVSGGVSLPKELLYLLPAEAGNVSPQALMAAARYCAAELGTGYNLPGPADVSPDLGERAECYRGTLGVEALGIFTARRGIESARAAWESTLADYESMTLDCVRLLENGLEDAELRQAHGDEMSELRDAKRRIDDMMAVANAIISGASLGMNVSGSFASAATETKPSQQAWQLGTAAATTPLVLELMLGQDARDLEEDMIDAQERYENMMAMRELGQEVQECFAAARRVRNQFPVAQAQVRERAAELQQARGRLKAGQQQVEHLIVQGRAQVLREQGRETTMVSHHYWLNEYVDRYQQQFQWAKKLLYLGLLAVEYEYQTSTPVARNLIMTASSVADLDAALLELQRLQAMQTIGGKPVGQPYVKVIGLREGILQLVDQPAPGKTAIEQLRERFLRPEAEIWHNGEHIGNGVRFTLPPELLVPNLCAERLWGVGARIVALPIPGYREDVRLYKSNNFASNCCAGQCQGDQDAQVNPSINPLGGGDMSGDPIRDGYSSALINAQINGDEGGFFNPMLPVPLLTQFAGRGVGGQYVLVIPWNKQKNALAIPIEKLLNIQLRFEFYAIDNAPSMGQ